MRSGQESMTSQVMDAMSLRLLDFAMLEGFPHWLRAHRIRRRWSQEQLGFEAGVSPRHLSCLESLFPADDVSERWFRQSA